MRVMRIGAEDALGASAMLTVTEVGKSTA